MSETNVGDEPWLMRTPPLEAVTCLFFFVLFLVVFIRHLYVTGFLGRTRLVHFTQEAEARAEARGRLNARIRAFIDLVIDSAYARAAATAQQQQHRGLDATAFKALPAMVFHPEDFKTGVECAVCLGELTAGEAVRPLPECGHVFHVECIDMWFFSHSTCPLCRSPLLPEPIRRVESATSLNPPTNLLPPILVARTIGAYSRTHEESSSSSPPPPPPPSRKVETVDIEISCPAPPLPESVLRPEKDVKWPRAADSGSSREGDIEEGCVPARTSTAQRS